MPHWHLPSPDQYQDAFPDTARRMWEAAHVNTGSRRHGWLLMAAGDDRGHAGNLGYADQIDAFYSWDSKVPNWRRLSAGDPIALWDKKKLLGISVIEQIDTSEGHKLLNRCPFCRTTRISARKNHLPKFRCMRCKQNFEEGLSEFVQVQLFRARYDAAWVPLDGVLLGHELRELTFNQGDINAMRTLDWAAFEKALSERGSGTAASRVSTRADINWHGMTLEVDGFTQNLARVRRGQASFREHLIESQGHRCAFTGPAPGRALEAGHLYSYAQLGTHFEHGGLMLRRDVHALFDAGDLSVDPTTLRIDVSSKLEKFPQYAILHERELTFNLRDKQLAWLAIHWDEHRARKAGDSDVPSLL